MAEAQHGMVLAVNIFVDVKDRDPEEVAQEFSMGTGNIETAIQGFPGAEVWGVDLDTIREATDEEKSAWLSE